MALKGDDFHNPALTGPRPSHNIPNGGLFSAYANTKINASPKAVYDAILDVGEWKQWNTFVHDVTITKNPHPHARKEGSSKRIAGGACMIFHVKMSDDYKTTSREVVTLIENLKLSKDGHSTPCITRIRWRLDNAAISTPSFLLKAERTIEIEEAHDGTTIYRHWQTFGGPISRFVRSKFEQPLKDRMVDWCKDLKKWVEEKKGDEDSHKPDVAGQEVE
jgi:hypothetical protein